MTDKNTTKWVHVPSAHHIEQQKKMREYGQKLWDEGERDLDKIYLAMAYYPCHIPIKSDHQLIKHEEK